MIYSKIIIKILNFFDYFQQKKIIDVLNKKLSKPIIVFDIGAHYGETIKLFIRNFSIKMIYSFEASPKNFKVLKSNISNYCQENVKIYNFGFGDKIHKTYINQIMESSSSTINDLNINSSYLKKKLKVLNVKNHDKFFYKLPIELITLDHFIKENDINCIDILKIDTEGYELNILKGLSKYFERVRFIYFEHHYDDMIIKNYKFYEINSLLKKRGFINIKKTKMYFRKSFEYLYENKNKKF